MQKLLLLCTCVLALLSVDLRAEESAAPSTPQQSITIYYFHNTFRCPSCNSIESLTKAAALGGKGENTKYGNAVEVTSPFADLVASKQLTVVSLNADKEENKALLKTIKAQMKIPLIVEKSGDTVKSTVALKDVWTLLGDSKKFVLYVQEQLTPVATRVRDAKE